MSLLTPEELQYQITYVSDDRRGAVVAASVSCAVISYIFVALRLVAHRKSGTKLQPDDWAIMVSLLFATGQCVDSAVGVAWGLGRHLILLTDPISFGKNLISAEVIYIAAIAMVKISILLLWNRLFTSKSFRIAIWSIGALVILMSIAAILVVCFQCIPIEHLWNPRVPAKCVNMSLAVTIFGALNILTDLLIILLPIKQLMKLRLQKREKLQLYGLFLTGGFVTIISVARMFFTIHMVLDDVTWTYVDACIWSSAEIAAAIVSACLPTLRPLFGQSRDRTGAYVSYPSIGLSQRRSQMYQLGEGDAVSSKPVAKMPMAVKMAPAWRDTV